MSISINKPCTEQWEGMEPNRDGRHCDRCCKTVMDFSNWEAEAIAAYLQWNDGKEVCGRIQAAQVSATVLTNKRTPVAGIWRSAMGLANKIAGMILLAIGFASTGCKEEQHQTPEQMAAHKQDINKDSLNMYTLGMIESDVPDSSYRLKNTDSTHY